MIKIKDIVQTKTHLGEKFASVLDDPNYKPLIIDLTQNQESVESPEADIAKAEEAKIKKICGRCYLNSYLEVPVTGEFCPKCGSKVSFQSFISV